MQPQPLDPRYLRQLQRLVNLYAHSRILPLTIVLAVLVLNVGIIMGTIALLSAIDEPPWATWAILVSCIFLVLASDGLAGYLTYQYGPRFYARDGVVKLPPYYGNVCCWVLYLVTFLVPVFAQPTYLTPRQAVVICLCSYGTFILYLGRKDGRVSSGCFGGLMLLGAIGYALGVPLPATGEHAFFLTLMGTIVIAGLIAVAVVHTFNRRVLRKMQGMRLGGTTEDTANPGH